MATYEYKCSQCGYEFEISTRIEYHSTVAECPSCDGVANQVFRTLPKFNSYFEGSVKAEYEGL